MQITSDTVSLLLGHVIALHADRFRHVVSSMLTAHTGVAHASELSSKRAKARAPNTHHDSSSEWQRQGAGAKGEVEEWEGDLLILGVGNAQQAGQELQRIMPCWLMQVFISCTICLTG